jgi:predicted ABC-type sugar transport system permease subunit
MLFVTNFAVENEFTQASLDVSMRSAVVAGGYLSKPESLAAALELPVRALILSSVAASLVDAAANAPIPIVLMEGFGRLPMNQIAAKLLKTNEKREIAVNAVMDIQRNEKPELFIPLPAQGTPAEEFGEINAGKVVRVTMPPYAGQAGTLVSLRPGLTLLSNGQRVHAADIQLETNQIITVPLANLDMLE